MTQIRSGAGAVGRFRYRALALMVALTNIFLTACAPRAGEALPGYAGTPTAVGTPLSITSDGSKVDAWAVGDLLVITTHGSGSCPWEPELVEINEEARHAAIEISVSNGDGPCTADMSPRTFEVHAGRDLTSYTLEVTTRMGEN
ncbi:hypothetical protein [Microbacterium sp. Yaish 1]|uniref:hypothetical protein n=1 Tax=Microbacterium sp. Yaish 1 TaxID=2025014 RepID=UPI00117D2539|nr:hypothetical protein [Microbacterium sp. Yaish 1]